jgi:hypothetical protein
MDEAPHGHQKFRRDRESEARACRPTWPRRPFEGVMAREDAVGIFGWDPGAIVLDTQTYPGVIRCACQPDPREGELDCVFENVGNLSRARAFRFAHAG